MMAFRQILLYSIPVPLVLYLWQGHIVPSMRPFNAPARQTCIDPHGLSDTYDAPGYFPLIDRVVCVLIRFCTHAINDPFAFFLTTNVLGTATSMFAMVSVEGTRQKSVVLASTTVFLLLGNVIGAGFTVPLLWFPAYGLLAKKTSRPVDGPRIAGIAAATILGHLMPAALATSQISTYAQRNVLAVFQYSPLIYGFIEHVLPPVIRSTRLRVWLPSDIEMAKSMYVGLAAVNAFLFYWVSLRVLLFSPSGTLLNYARLVYTPQIDPVSHMLFWDVSSMVATMLYFALLQHGFPGIRCLIKGSILLGPGAGVALYGWKREQWLRAQDINSPLEKKSH